jgi:hypothetical protein
MMATIKGTKNREDPMYQPVLRPDQIRTLYYLKVREKRPMTRLVREAVDIFLALHGGPEAIIPAETETDARAGRHSRATECRPGFGRLVLRG